MTSKTKISRRQLLALTGGAIGVTALTCSGLAVVGTRQPEIKLIESSYGEAKNKGDKVLIAYASRCGSTGGVAEAIARVLVEAGAAVDVRLAKNVADLSAYRAVVVGSAIRMSQWLPEAMEFVNMHREALNQVPVAYFLVCLTMSKDKTEETRRTVAAYMDPVQALVHPVSQGLFAGALDFDALPLIPDGLIMRAMGTPAGDFRDWEAIRVWAAGLRSTLLGA